VIEADSLWSLVERRAQASPDAPFAFDERDRAHSFADYRNAALRVAAGLHARGIGPESRVTWVLPTWVETMVLAGALARLGAVQNPVLPIYREREVGFIVRQTGAELLVVPPAWRGFDYPALADALARELSGLEVLALDGALPEADPASLPAFAPTAVGGESPVRWVFYTSGTTADPKGARHTDATLIASAGGMARALDLTPEDRHGLVFPFTHVGGIGWLIAGLMAGCAQVPVAIFDPPKSIPRLARHGVSLAGAGTAFHQAYLAAQRAAPERPLLPRVRAFPGGGAPKPPALHTELKQAFGGAGIVSGYGLTECPIIAMNTLCDPDEKLAHTEGRASPAGAQIRVVAPDGSDLPTGAEGELRIRGPQLCRGYVDAGLDREAFDADGFFRTGDLGRVDDEGYVVITGRSKDVIIRKGENISAKEVEDLLYTHPAVADVAVIGLADPALGERCCAVVALAPGADLAFDEMSRFLRERGLMVQKIPEQLEVVAEIPRNAAGKVPKHELRARYA
jgi:acyl-CoA synthetase (AMP-forming)/AMP-acid ligase II